jgi:hypothetical protein
MSGYNYDDRTFCKDCYSKYTYSDLKNLTNYECDQTCMCRASNERSVRDRMDYDVYVLGKNVNLQPEKPSIGWIRHTYQENDTL